MAEPFEFVAAVDMMEGNPRHALLHELGLNLAGGDVWILIDEHCRRLVRFASLRDRAVKQILPELGKMKNATNEKARRVLGWTPRSREDAVIATAESLVRLGLLKGGVKSVSK